jgi:glucose-1-phosphate adenylyltransferase
MAMAAIASPSSKALIPARHHTAASPSTSGDYLRALPQRHSRRGHGVSVSTLAPRRRPFVFSPRAVSDSKSSQTCLDPDASTVRSPRAREILAFSDLSHVH